MSERSIDMPEHPRGSSKVQRRWTWNDDEGSRWLEIEHDRMAEDEQHVVTLWAEQKDDDGEATTLVCATPSQAREMAASLMHYADAAEKANAPLQRSRDTPNGAS